MKRVPGLVLEHRRGRSPAAARVSSPPCAFRRGSRSRFAGRREPRARPSSLAVVIGLAAVTVAEPARGKRGDAGSTEQHRLVDSKHRSDWAHLYPQGPQALDLGLRSRRGRFLEATEPLHRQQDGSAPGDPTARQGHGRAGGDLLVPARQILFVADDDKNAILRFGRGSDGKIGTRDDNGRL
jgi:hypothetical protein